MRTALKNIIVGSICAFAAPLAYAAADPETGKSILEDARLIITSAQNDVRLWAHPPRIIVFGDRVAREYVRRIVDQVEGAVETHDGSNFFGEVRFEQLPVRLGEGQQSLWVRIRKGGPSGRNIQMHLGGEAVFETDIVIIVADRPSIALMNGLWGMPPSANRSMLEGGDERCFYSAKSRHGIRFGVLVSIFPSSNLEMLEECLWEELLHALGPLQDAEGSEFFSFDNQFDMSRDLTAAERNQITARKRANDLLLIRALYESGVKPGGSPDTVIDYLENLITR